MIALMHIALYRNHVLSRIIAPGKLRKRINVGENLRLKVEYKFHSQFK
jgi:hypothetical protein